MRSAALLVFAALPLTGQICDPAPEVRAALNMGVPGAATVQAKYAALREEHPGDPAYITLYAHSLLGSKTKEAIPLLSALSYPPALVELARIYSSSKFQDDGKLRSVWSAYEKECPASLDIYAFTGRIDDAAFARDHGPKLRRILQDRTDPEALRLYSLLWTMEFKSVALAQQAPLRERVKADAARLREFGAGNPAAMKSLSRAYQLLGDVASQQWIADHAPAAAPSEAAEANRAINQLFNQNLPGGELPDGTQLQQELKQTEEWIKRWPREPEPWRVRFQALAQLPNAPRDELARVAAEWIRLYELRGNSGYPPYPLYLDIARIYAARDIHPDQVSGLIDKQVKEVLDAVDSPRSDLMPDPDPSGLLGLNSKWNTLEAAADLEIQLHRFDPARDMLANLGASMANRQAGVHEYRYWNLMAQLARGENRTLDALTYERNAIAANRRDSMMDVGAANQPAFNARRAKVDADRTVEARALWKTLGGGDQAFYDWLNMPQFAPPPETPTQIAARDPWTRVNQLLPDFSMGDLQGKTWRLADLKGKVTLVNLWATWCEPCREELPHVQKLYEQLRYNSAMTVVTLNMDENTGLIEPFLKEHGFTFPVLPALEYAREFGLISALPSTWIVGEDGTIIERRVGAGLSDRWIDDMLARMEKAGRKQ